jgi:ABC-type uncharacterized transport system substrate-binding protein
MKAAALCLALALGVLFARPIADAQPAAKTYRIGFLGSQSPAAHRPRLEAFRQGLAEHGYVEGRNIVIEFRWAEGDYKRLPGLAKELVALTPDLIISTGGPPAALALKAGTRTIPIVFLGGPAVETGIVPSIARPGGNLTGLDVFAVDLDGKRLALLKEAFPKASRVAVLWNPAPGRTDPSPRRERVEVAGRSLGLQLRFLEVRRPGEIDTAFAAMVRERPGALLVLADPMLDSQRTRIVESASRNRLPAMYQWREFAEDGGLMSYGADLTAIYRRLGTYVDKILKGAKPGDLPVEQPTKFELVVNLKTAKALGLRIPPSILLQADKVIE